MSSAVLNGPGLTRTVPSGNVPSARWMYGAQCSPGRMAMSNAWSRMPPSSVAGSDSLRKLMRADPAGMVAVAEDRDPVDFVQPPPKPLDQLHLVAVDRFQAAFLDVLDAGNQARRCRARSACRLRGSTGNSFGCVSLDESPPVPPSRQAAASPAGRRRAPRVPVGPNSDLWPGKASKSMCIACTSIGTTPAVWAASTTRNSISCSRAIRPISATGCTVPSTLLACVTAISRVFGVIARRMRVGIDRAAPVGRDAGQRNRAGQFHCPQRPADAVVLQVDRDDVVAGIEHALEGDVERVGAVESEDQPLRPGPVEELVEPVPAVVEDALGRDGHLVPGPAGVGKLRAAEAIQCRVDGFRLRKTGGGVVEVGGHGDAGRQ